MNTLPVDTMAVELQDGGSMLPPLRFSSTVPPEQAKHVNTDANGPSISERGSNVAVPSRLMATPQRQHHVVLRDADHPVCSDPGPGMHPNWLCVG